MLSLCSNHIYLPFIGKIYHHKFVFCYYCFFFHILQYNQLMTIQVYNELHNFYISRILVEHTKGSPSFFFFFLGKSPTFCP